MVREGKIPAVKIENVENNRIIIRVPYNQELIKKIKAFPERRWNAEKKYWEIPYSEGIIPKLQNLFGENIFIDSYLPEIGTSLEIFIQVIFIRHLEDIWYALKKLDVFVLPTLLLEEGLSRVLLEATAMNKQMIATRVDSNPEVVNSSTTGLLVPPGDIKGLSAY
jgi:glycosyltransferase involved in cell wall biosynthesis